MSAVEIDVIEGSAKVAAVEPLRTRPQARIEGVLIGRLVGFKSNGATPLITYPSQLHSAALAARATLDLHGAHIGRAVVLQFEAGDPLRPIIIGLLQSDADCPSPEPASHVEVDADGERLVVTAKRQLVLRCGKASITLTHAGKVLIQGTYVSNRSSGVMRIKGGSVQLN